MHNLSKDKTPKEHLRVAYPFVAVICLEEQTAEDCVHTTQVLFICRL